MKITSHEFEQALLTGILAVPLTPVGSWNEKSVYKYELFVFNIDEIELFVFIGVENEQFVFNGIENAHLLYPLNSPFRINIWGGGRNVHYRFYRKRGFWPPPPIGSILQKIGKNQNRLRMAWNGEKSKKKFCPLVTPPRKKLRKLKKKFWKFFESCSESSETWKNSIFFFIFFPLFWVRLGESTPKALGILNH